MQINIAYKIYFISVNFVSYIILIYIRKALHLKNIPDINQSSALWAIHDC